MNRNLSVGLVVAAGAGILLLTVLMIGQEQAMFTPRNDYTVLLPNAEGLQTSSPVKLVGVQVGVVKQIRLPTPTEERVVRVTLSINRDFADRLREDTRANLRVLSLLGGEKYIELTLGSPDRPELAPGSEITAALSDIDRIFTQGSTIASDMAEITSSLKVIFERIQRREGMLGRLLMDPDFGKQSLEDLAGTLGSLQQISRQLETGEGLLGALLNDPQLRDQVRDEIRGILGGIDTVLTAARDPATPIGSVLTPGGEGQEVLENLRSASASFRGVAERLERGEGLIGRLVADPAYADRVLGDLEATLRHVASITAKIDRGEGSIGGLVNDPALYQGLRDVVTGLQESRLLRWMVRRYGGKGARVRESKAGDEAG